ncbi:hypothetical protein AMQ84_21000 [Paenibacillus riograndensis]|uniref:LysM domain-containing protein n=1 Tax=Paenibacillus riograndensis TaxID=483937 RepID=A0A132TRR3_9BACL|nr:LysM peptidoglycan-binding domain-containing protein [Paenibacillus riograndensis]KWX74058.1 hypothetical protein AMQ84_21000 [Paenibacillus riograndensis]
MQIHVVQAGQSLYGIAQAYGVNADEISEANQLSAPGRLVVGQTLVIPITGMYYWVQPGDSLYTIARRFGVGMSDLAASNQLSLNQPLQIGFRLYIPPGPKRKAEINAYIEPRGEVSQSLQNAAAEAAPHLTYLAPFSFRVQRDGSLEAPHFDYTDDAGKPHKVWFEDARSIQAKFTLLKELGLRGISYWKLGLPFPQNWLLIEDNFQVVKR